MVGVGHPQLFWRLLDTYIFLYHHGSLLLFSGFLMLPLIFFFLLPLFLSFGEINASVSREHSRGG